MEAEEEEEKEASSSSFCHGFLRRHHPTSPFVGLGLAVGLCYLTTTTLILIPARPPKPLSVAIKLASSAVTGAKAGNLLHNPLETLLLASKTLVKGYKVSKRLNLIGPGNSTQGGLSLSKVVGTLKPWLGAVSIVRFVGSPVQDFGFLGFGLLSYGYKFSKNLFTVLRGVAGLEMDVGLKNGFESLGLVVKAVKVAGELGQIRRRAGGGGQTTASFPGYGSGGAHCAIGLTTSDVGCEKRPPMGSAVDRCLSFSDDEVGNGIDFVGEGRSNQAWVSDLLCLSIPLKQEGLVW